MQESSVCILQNALRGIKANPYAESNRELKRCVGDVRGSIRPETLSSLSPKRRGFNPRPVNVIFVVDDVEQGQVFLRIHRFCHVSIIPPMLHAYSFITDAI
jgi:hypothetical protein